MNKHLQQLGIQTYKWAALRHDLLPRVVEVETTKSCNLRCPGCRRNYSASISSEPGETHLTPTALQDILSSCPIRAVRFEGDGEPMCNPNFEGLVRLCHFNNARTMMTCNGTLLNEKWVEFLQKHGMTRIHISFDGADKHTYEKVKLGANFEQVLHNCKLIGESGIQLYMNVVLFSDEVVEQLPQYVRLATQVGATGIHYMKMQSERLGFGNPPKIEPHIQAIQKFRQLAKQANLHVTGTCTDTPTFSPCYDPFISPFVLLNKDVYACTYMANLRRSEVYNGKEFPTPYLDYRMGNIAEDTLKEVWTNPTYKSLRRHLRSTRQPTGRTMSIDQLTNLKGLPMIEPLEPFEFCEYCLCQWGESGL